MTWNAHINIKANGKLNEAHWDKVKKWPEVDQIWSTQGDWDWMIKLRSAVNSLDDLEKFVFNLRKEAWVSETHTWWAKPV